MNEFKQSDCEADHSLLSSAEHEWSCTPLHRIAHAHNFTLTEQGPVKPSQVARKVTFLICIQEVTGSSLCCDTDWPDRAFVFSLGLPMKSQDR